MSRLENFKKLFTKALSPAEFKCMICGVDVFDGLGFCPHCKKHVVFNNGKTCLRCGVAIRGEEDYCGHCAFEKIYFDRAYSPFSYEQAVQQAILKLKFGKVATNAQIFAKYIAYVAKSNNLQYDIVTFVPMTDKARKARGYNQAQLLAKHFCDIMGEESKFGAVLSKIKDTERQETLGKKQRQENLIGAFASTADVKGKSILLIDDIKTTGSTLNECAKALKKKGATRVVGITVASREENFDAEITS